MSHNNNAQRHIDAVNYEDPITLVHSGDPDTNAFAVASDGGGQFPNSYRLTDIGLAQAAAWLVKHAGPREDDCVACDVLVEVNYGPDQCPVHQGRAEGWDHAAEAVKKALESDG